MAVEQLCWVICWIALLKLLQLPLIPLLKRTFGEISYPLSYSLGLLLFALASWYSGIAGLPLYCAFVPFALLVLLSIREIGFRFAPSREQIRWDLVFLAAFSILLYIRFLNPSISFAEKFMDHAFLASIMRNPVVPPLDPWYAGGRLDIYYYLGYWAMGAMGVVTQVPSTVVFNLALPTVFALAVLNALAFASVLLTRYRWVVVAAVFLINPAFVKELLLGAPLNAVMWNSTRVIQGTINEYPLFSFLWGDVHPHVMGIFNQLLLLALLAFAERRWANLEDRSRLLLVLACALSLGSMPPINAWDVLVYAPLVLLVFSILALRERQKTKEGCRIHASMVLLVIPALSILAYLLYYLAMRPSGISGVGFVEMPSDLLQFLLVHGIFLVILYIHIFRDLIERPYCLLAAVPFVFAGYHAAAVVAIPFLCLVTRRQITIVEILSTAGLLAFLLPEIVFLRDIYGGEYYRMNTVFKFYSAGWLLVSTAAGCMLAKPLEGVKLSPIASRTIRALVLLLALALFIAPLFADLDYGYDTGTLDGARYLEYSHPGDAAAIRFLRNLEGEHVLLEAAKGDYSYHSRVSTFTGIPAVIGQPGHELVWRGPQAGINERVSDVRRMYEDPGAAPALYARYGVDLVYVGALEAETYRVALPLDYLEVIYGEGGVTIYRVRGATRNSLSSVQEIG